MPENSSENSSSNRDQGTGSVVEDQWDVRSANMHWRGRTMKKPNNNH
jgi:hypothetical protein